MVSRAAHKGSANLNNFGEGSSELVKLLKGPLVLEV